MDKSLIPFQDLLEKVGERPPRSRLEPYRRLIDELRRRNFTFREIAEVLGEQCGVKVTRAGVHHFVRLGSRRNGRQPPVGTRTPARPTSSATAHLDLGEFQFEPDEPLRLSGDGKSRS